MSSIYAKFQARVNDNSRNPGDIIFQISAYDGYLLVFNQEFGLTTEEALVISRELREAAKRAYEAKDG